MRNGWKTLGALLMTLAFAGLAKAATCDIDFLRNRAEERRLEGKAQSTENSTSEGAHLELGCAQLVISSLDPFTVQGDIVFENQGSSALTIRGISSGTADTVTLSQSRKVFGVVQPSRDINTVRVNGNSLKELTAANGYLLTLTDFPPDYRNPGITSLYVDLGPDNDPRWDDRGQLMIVRWNKTLPDG